MNMGKPVTILVSTLIEMFFREVGMVQGASGIDARFLKSSPALTVCPIMTKF
jgi:hypothetical protein